LPPTTTVVERIGTVGRSITFERPRGDALLACESAGAPGEGGRYWCGVAFGQLVAGRLRDPRLDLGCRARSGRLVAFAWVTPLPRARWIGVDQGAYEEVYEVAGGLPVRIASAREVQLRGSSATFELTQYGPKGRLLTRRKLVVRVAG
jgi:hypothetical protein